MSCVGYILCTDQFSCWNNIRKSLRWAKEVAVIKASWEEIYQNAKYCGTIVFALVNYWLCFYCKKMGLHFAKSGKSAKLTWVDHSPCQLLADKLNYKDCAIKQKILKYCVQIISAAQQTVRIKCRDKILFDQRINCGKHVKCTVSKTGSCSPTRGFVKLKSSSKELDSKSYILVSVSLYLYLNHAYRKVMTNTNTVEWHWKPPYYEIIPKRIV